MLQGSHKDREKPLDLAASCGQKPDYKKPGAELAVRAFTGRCGLNCVPKEVC